MTQTRGLKRGFALEDSTAAILNQCEWGLPAKRHNSSANASCSPGPQHQSAQLSGCLADASYLQSFLLSFARTRETLQSECPLTIHGQPGTDFVWQSLAELNLLFERNFHALPGSALLSYHSFTRSTKPLIWNRFATAYWPASGSGAAAPLQVQVVHYVLNKALAACTDAQLVEYRLTVPPWLAPWCARWHCGPHDLTVLAVHGYAPTDGHQPEQTHVMYVPVVGRQ